jgi:hypothetical protein
MTERIQGHFCFIEVTLAAFVFEFQKYPYYGRYNGPAFFALHPARYFRRRLRCVEGMPMSSRYLATVRRVTMMPLSRRILLI